MGPHQGRLELPEPYGHTREVRSTVAEGRQIDIDIEIAYTGAREHVMALTTSSSSGPGIQLLNGTRRTSEDH